MATPIRIFWLPGSSTNPNLPKLQPLGWADSFDRPNSSSLGTTDNGVPWVTSGTWAISGGAARCTAGSGSLWAVADAFTADGELTVLVSAIEEYAGVAFRHVDDANRLFVNWLDGNLRLYKRVGGTSTLVTTVAGAAPVAGDTITVTLNGTSVVVKKNGTQVLTETVTEHRTATRHGLLAGAAGSTVRFASAAFVAA